jgi:hypothetical protein
VFVESHPRRSLASFPGPTSISCPPSPKPFPFISFADPHVLNPYSSYRSKNHGGRAYPELLSRDPVGVTADSRFKSFSCNTYEPPRKCCKQKTYPEAKSFSCNTYKKPGEGGRLWLTRFPIRKCLEEHRDEGSLSCQGAIYALASSFSSAFPFRNHGRSRLCMYRGNVRFFASNFCVHSRDSSRRFAVFRKLA